MIDRISSQSGFSLALGQLDTPGSTFARLETPDGVAILQFNFHPKRFSPYEENAMVKFNGSGDVTVVYPPSRPEGDLRADSNVVHSLGFQWEEFAGPTNKVTFRDDASPDVVAMVATVSADEFRTLYVILPSRLARYGFSKKQRTSAVYRLSNLILEARGAV
jgi:hypothetical protein